MLIIVHKRRMCYCTLYFCWVEWFLREKYMQKKKNIFIFYIFLYFYIYDFLMMISLPHVLSAQHYQTWRFFGVKNWWYFGIETWWYFGIETWWYFRIETSTNIPDGQHNESNFENCKKAKSLHPTVHESHLYLVWHISQQNSAN